jgi:hypothetical protein
MTRCFRVSVFSRKTRTLLSQYHPIRGAKCLETGVLHLAKIGWYIELKYP